MPPARTHHRLDPLGCALAALLVYALLGQRTLYSVDAHGMLLQGQHEGVGLHPSHFTYLPLLALCREIGGLLGVSLYTAGVWLSACGAAIGVGLAHVANVRLLPTRRLALLATALVATTPALVFYATVLEVHGQHFACCGAAFVATAAFADNATVGRGSLLGLATGLGYLGHATGALLPAALLPLAVALAYERGTPWCRTIPGLAAALLGHAVVVFGTPLLLSRLGVPADTAFASGLLRMHLNALAHDPLVVLDAAWRDWLVPFAPIAAVALLALVARRTRGLATALLLGTCVYVAVTAALLLPIIHGVVQPGHNSEHGAYLLPLAWPFALVTARWVRAPWLLAVLAGLAAALAVYGVRTHDTRPQAALAAGMRTLQGERAAFTLVGGHDEIAAMLVDLPERRTPGDWQAPVTLLDMPVATVPHAVAAFDGWLREKRAAGVELWVTAGCVATLQDPAWVRGRPGAAALLQLLREHYTWTERRASGCIAFQLEPLPR